MLPHRAQTAVCQTLHKLSVRDARLLIGEDIKELDIEIIDDDKYEKAETFRVVLSNPSPGAELARRGKQV
eukprot:2984983-Pleurochrysis_carterae.AAC.1